MARTDRAFHALARTRPDALLTLARTCVPELDLPDVPVTPEMLDDARLFDALPPPLAGDVVLRIRPGDIMHMECQGYRERGFPERTFRYHLGFVLRHWPNTVHTVVLWLFDPPASQKREVLAYGNVVVMIHSIVLTNTPASLLLVDPRTACFAAGADAGEMPERALCQHVAQALRDNNATYVEQQMALALSARHQGRTKMLLQALGTEESEQDAVADLIELQQCIFRDRELARIEAEALLMMLEARGIHVDEPARKRIEGTGNPDTLEGWIRRTAKAESLREVLGEEAAGAC